VIQLGNWIDLDGGLTVAASQVAAKFSSDDETVLWDDDITLNDVPWGKMKRLIVVGINSFNGINDNDTPHVVFQFQNIPILNWMNETNGVSGGYLACKMRVYLKGKFLNGLIEAGVPEEVLWGPTRVMAAGTINDLLWLPTEREMFQNGTSEFKAVAYGPYSKAEESENNQARLEYYANNESRIKISQSSPNFPQVEQELDGYSFGEWYWSASVSGSAYCRVTPYGYVSAAVPTTLGGCVPAFCVK
jgi:hypothetical protein